MGKTIVAFPTMSRRRLLAGLAGLPAAGAVVVATRRLADAAPVFRPGPRSANSAVTCAQCGAGDHTMLASSCPAAPGVVRT